MTSNAAPSRASLRALAVLGAGNFATLTLSVLAAKVIAYKLGVAGYGRYSLVASALGIAVMVSALSLPTTAVRSIARAGRDPDGTPEREAGAVFGLSVVLGISGAAVLALFRKPVAAALLGDGAASWAIAAVAVAVPFVVVQEVWLALLNAFERHRALAWVTALARGASLCTMALAIARYGEAGIVPGIVGGAVLGLLTTVATSYGHAVWLRNLRFAPALSRVREGVTYWLSRLLGAGVHLIAPAIIVSFFGDETVGFFRAGAALAIGYCSILTAVLAQEFYPRIARADPADSANLSRASSEQALLMLSTVGAAALLVHAGGAELLALFFAPEFAVGREILSWQALGTVFQISVWPWSYVLLSHGRPAAYLLCEIVAGLSMVAGLVISGVGDPAFLGVPYAVAYLLYGVVVIAYCFNRWKVIPERDVVGALVLAVAAWFAIEACHWWLEGFARLLVLSSISVIVITTGAFGAVRLRTERSGVGFGIASS